MAESQQGHHLLYKQALVDPSALSEEDILGLLVKYPYSQPLIFAYERRKKLLNEQQPLNEMSLLYAPNANWLFNFVHKPVSVVEELVPEQEDYVPFEEWSQEILQAEEVSETTSVEEDQHELDKLALGAGVGGDYFVFEEKNTETGTEQETLSPIVEEEKEDISLYNDELMPYSFRWWLHKTRLEYADTYQPFAVPNLNKSKPAQIAFDQIDQHILDQQIKENIIHFQDPEEKLSEEVKKKPALSAEPKKTDEIIERFIKEEPIIKAPSAENLHNENMARRSAEDNYVLVTETLANIYIDQALYLKAIEVFKKLILKYPEKKSYFATRIQELENKI